jgi:hypothetical protein
VTADRATPRSRMASTRAHAVFIRSCRPQCSASSARAQSRSIRRPSPPGARAGLHPLQPPLHLLQPPVMRSSRSSTRTSRPLHLLQPPVHALPAGPPPARGRRSIRSRRRVQSVEPVGGQPVEMGDPLRVDLDAEVTSHGRSLLPHDSTRSAPAGRLFVSSPSSVQTTKSCYPPETAQVFWSRTSKGLRWRHDLARHRPLPRGHGQTSRRPAGLSAAARPSRWLSAARTRPITSPPGLPRSRSPASLTEALVVFLHSGAAGNRTSRTRRPKNGAVSIQVEDSNEGLTCRAAETPRRPAVPSVTPSRFHLENPHRRHRRSPHPRAARGVRCPR